MSSRAVYWLVTYEKPEEVVQSYGDAAWMVLATYLALMPIFSHSILGISIEPDVCNF